MKDKQRKNSRYDQEDHRESLKKQKLSAANDGLGRQVLLARLAEADVQTDRRYGQNFLHDQRALSDIVAALDPDPNAFVVEIGAGAGTLSEAILNSLGKEACLHSYELDQRLEGLLRPLAVRDPRFCLHMQDAREMRPEELYQEHRQSQVKTGAEPQALLISNLPYQITTELLYFVITQYAHLFSRLVIMVQKEVSTRLTAKAGDQAYGPLAVLMQSYGHLQKCFDLPPHAFYPPPKVQSRVYRLTRYEEVNAPNRVASASLLKYGTRYLTSLQLLFAQKRRQLLPSLYRLSDEGAFPARNWEAYFVAQQLDPKLRAQQLSVEQLGGLVAYALEAGL